MEKKLYKLVTADGDDVDLSHGIGSDAAEHVPVNFGRQVIASVASKTGDQLSKPGLILTWLLTSLGAPAVTIGLLVPVRESGSLLPQLVVANFISRREIRKSFWVVGSLLQGFAILGMGFVALFLKGAPAGWSVVVLLVVFSLARGVCSISSSDLLGKTIPRTRRGRLGGLSSAISGWIAVVVAVFFIFNKAQELPVSLFAGLLFAAGILWLFAALIMSRVIEIPGESSAGDGFFREMKASLGLVKTDPVFLRFCIARALLASTVLSMPFYVVLAHEATGGRIRSLGILMIAGSLATALSGVTWGKISDVSSRKTLAIAGLAAGLTGCITAWVSSFQIGETAAATLYGALFFLIGLAHTGIRIGRKTYLVDHATQDNRARLVAVSNTLMGIILLLSGSFGLLAGVLGERVIILIFAILGIAGSLLAITLPEAGES